MSVLSLLLASNLFFAAPAHSIPNAGRPALSGVERHSAGYWRHEWRRVLTGYDVCGNPVYRQRLVRVWVSARHPRVVRYRYSCS